MTWLASTAVLPASDGVPAALIWLVGLGIVVGAAVTIWKGLWPITKAAVLFVQNWGAVVTILPALMKLAAAADALLQLAEDVAGLKTSQLAIQTDMQKAKDDIATILAGHNRVRATDPPVSPQEFGR